MRHLVIRTQELQNPEYARNAPNRCFFCKEELFTRLEPVAEAEGLPHLVYGANLDDLGDHRPGMVAARQKGVTAPLLDAGLTKQEIRELSRAAGLPTWDKPSF
ncbi:MAG: TIGR00268 family protein, partial [Candidatus Rokubacteria bacterium]|nr:TIGR00268 family protein [Candidatus Rokubacteria bacterium]